MFFVKLFYRSSVQYPLYTMLNIFGLAFGIAVFMVLAIYVRFETGFESWIKAVDQIYLVKTETHFPNSPRVLSHQTMGGLLEEIHQDFADLVGTRVWDNDIIVHQGVERAREHEKLVDADFFAVFDLPVIQGDRERAFKGPDRIVLTEAMAKKYFGSLNPIGQVLQIDDSGKVKSFTVSAILKDLPQNTELNFDFIRLLNPDDYGDDSNWHHYGSEQLATYLSFKSAAQARAMEGRFDDFLDLKAATAFASVVPHTLMQWRLAPLTTLHLEDQTTRLTVLAIGWAGFLAFGIAVINYVNLATSRASLRAREVAIQKTLGATRRGLLVQFLGEGLINTLIGTLIALSLVEISLPFINYYGGQTLSFYDRQDLGLFAWMMGVIVLIGGLSAVYPALILANFRPARVLAASKTVSGGKMSARVREILVVFQFAVVIGFLILSIGFIDEIDHLKQADLGFQRDGVLLMTATRDQTMRDDVRQSLWAALRSIPDVQSVTASTLAPGDVSQTDTTTVAVHGAVGPAPTINWTEVGLDYFTLYQAHLLAGRVLDQNYGGDLRQNAGVTQGGSEPVQNIVINNSAVRRLGFTSPQQAIDQIVRFSNRRDLRIVGVVDDLRFFSPKEKSPAMLYLLNPRGEVPFITAIRFKGVSDSVIRSRVANVWRRVIPDIPFEPVTAVENLNKYYREDLNRANLFNFGVAVTILIGVVGLYGLAAFNTTRRSLEIGLRKTMGATRIAVVYLLVGQFLRPVLVANLIAWPLAYWALVEWLAQFEDAITPNILSFLVGSIVVLFIAGATVAGIAFTTASIRPVTALRHG